MPRQQHTSQKETCEVTCTEKLEMQRAYSAKGKDELKLKSGWAMRRAYATYKVKRKWFKEEIENIRAVRRAYHEQKSSATSKSNTASAVYITFRYMYIYIYIYMIYYVN